MSDVRLLPCEWCGEGRAAKRTRVHARVRTYLVHGEDCAKMVRERADRLFADEFDPAVWDVTVLA